MLLGTRQESVNRLGVGDIQNVVGDRGGVSGVEDLNGGHTVRERGDIQHVRTRGGTSEGKILVPAVTTFAPEAVSIVLLAILMTMPKVWKVSGFHSSRNSGISRKSTGPSRGGNLVLDDEAPHVLQIARSEDESDAPDVGMETFKLGYSRRGASGNTSITSKVSKAPISDGKCIEMHFRKPSVHFTEVK